MMVALDLLKKGWSIFRSVSPSAMCDLVGVTPHRKLKRIEVTTGYIGNSGKLQYPPHEEKDYDILAVVVDLEDITYYGLEVD